MKNEGFTADDLHSEVVSEMYMECELKETV